MYMYIHMKFIIHPASLPREKEEIGHCFPRAERWEGPAAEEMANGNLGSLQSGRNFFFF